MSELLQKNPSYLIKHRNKWQVRVAIPKDVQWAFGNKSIFKRSTGCDLDDIEAATEERDKIVEKFKSIVELHRSGVAEQIELHRVLRSGFTRRPFPPESLEKEDGDIDSQTHDYQSLPQNNNYPAKVTETAKLDQNEGKNHKRDHEDVNVEGWINERLLKKSQQGKILRYDFWSQKKNKL